MAMFWLFQLRAYTTLPRGQIKVVGIKVGNKIALVTHLVGFAYCILYGDVQEVR